MSLRLSVFVAGFAALITGSVLAEAPGQSVIPQMRPGTEVAAAAPQRTVARENTDAAVRVALRNSVPGLRASPKPVPRPRFQVRAARPAPTPAAATTTGPERVVLASTAAPEAAYRLRNIEMVPLTVVDGKIPFHTPDVLVPICFYGHALSLDSASF